MKNTQTTGTYTATCCFHCGDPCNDIIRFDSHEFCCTGCKNVYELLSGNQLCDYYSLERMPGISQRNPVNSSKFAYLDEEAVQQKLIEFRDKNITRITLFIPLMHCSSCIWLLEHLYKLDGRIVSSRVNFLKKTLSLTFRNEASLRNVVELLSRLGYEPAISLNDLESEVKKDENRRLSYQIGVAGFCFGNSMLISFPEYFGLDEFARVSFAPLFGYLNFALSLPVFTFSAQDYFKSAWKGLRSGAIGIDVPLALGILVLFLRSTYEVFTHTGIGYFDTHVGLVFFLLIGKWFQQKTFDTLSFERDYKSYFPVAVTVLKSGSEQTVPVSSLLIGDRILIRNSELIPADSILLKGDARIDFSFVTGESDPVSKVTGEMIYAGGRQTGESIELEVCRRVSQSYLTQLWNSEHFAKETDTGMQSFQQTVSRYFTYALLVLASGSALFWLFVEPALALNAFTSVLIIACPCALALSSPFALGTAMRMLGRFKCYLKSPAVVEQMAKTGEIIFDKTGTITQPGESRIEFSGNALRKEHSILIASLACHSVHPLSRRIVSFLHEPQLLPVSSFEEITGKGIAAMVNGTRVQMGSHHFLFGTAETVNDLSTRVHVKIGEEYLGYFHIIHAYRPGLSQTIGLLKQEYGVHLLSGDNDSEREQLRPLFGERMLFHQSPPDKLNFISSLSREGKHTMMIGDGLNDAGALKAASVGISLTENTAHFSPASDVIMHASVFTKLPGFLRFSKATMKVIYASFGISLMYNLIGLAFAVQGTLSPLIAAILMPLSSVSVIAFTTVSVSWAARRLKDRR